MPKGGSRPKGGASATPLPMRRQMWEHAKMWTMTMRRALFMGQCRSIICVMQQFPTLLAEREATLREAVSEECGASRSIGHTTVIAAGNSINSESHGRAGRRNGAARAGD